MEVKDSDVACVVANRKVYIMDLNALTLQDCPLNDFLRRRYSAAANMPDLYEVPQTHVIGLHNAGKCVFPSKSHIHIYCITHCKKNWMHWKP